ncbi:penicillin-binding protein 1b; peptidoglycan synthetase [Candidatus Blochmanniella floridana]|uniref:Penicillin-binding protein 1B n=1 Tax=Blochmanniella floridana TaxID=203907 RepID=Q7VQH6_BLOFL|nr:penicillin-binding protein 1b; peptidoglycan synthetase [Candidatus Blochmannia floridanus]
MIINHVLYIMRYSIYVFIFIVLLIGVYGVILDTKIQNRINGQVWGLPTIVYSRIVHVEPNMYCSQEDMIRLLKTLQYREVSKITRSGEFIVYDNNIDLLRRSFDFPNIEEKEIFVSLYFNKDKLIRIYNQNTKNDFGLLRIDPKIISVQYAPQGQQRLFIPRSKFPDILIDMLLSVEDRYFYQHDGIRISAIIRACLANIVSGHTVQGGSTITQQLVKNLFLSNTRSLWRKFNEIYMALLFEYRYSKDRILELYLNEIYFGQNGNDQIRGFPLASFYYFGRPVDELSLDQQAMLIGMIKGASLYNPWKNPKKTLDRRNLVLKLLNNVHVIDSKLYDVLISRPLAVQSKDEVLALHPAFMQMVCEEINNISNMYSFHDLSGLRIFTTLDPIAQQLAEKAMKIGIRRLRQRFDAVDLEGAVVIIDRFSGVVRAMVGGADPHFSGFNRALYARRPIGSLIKPAIYLTALNQPNKYHLNTWIADTPIHLQQSNGFVWSPRNYDRQFRGKVMLIDAFVKSLNIPTVHLGLVLGLDTVVDFLIKLGISSNAISSFPSILLGAISLTPMEVAQEFQTIASGGQHSTMSCIDYIVNTKNVILYQYFPKVKRVVSPQSAYLVMYAMQQVVTKGTSYNLSLKFSSLKLAAKTGTTNDSRDSWFVGIDGKEVVVIWVGRDNNGKTKLTGTNGALKLYSLYLDMQSNPIPLKLTLPSNIVHIPIDYAGNILPYKVGKNSYEYILPIWRNNFSLLPYFDNKSEVVSYNQDVLDFSEKQDCHNMEEWINSILDE